MLTSDPRPEFRVGCVAYCGHADYSYYGRDGKECVIKECVIIKSALLKITMTEVDGTKLTILRTKRQRNEQIMLMKLESVK